MKEIVPWLSLFLFIDKHLSSCAWISYTTSPYITHHHIIMLHPLHDKVVAVYGGTSGTITLYWRNKQHTHLILRYRKGAYIKVYITRVRLDNEKWEKHGNHVSITPFKEGLLLLLLRIMPPKYGLADQFSSFLEHLSYFWAPTKKRDVHCKITLTHKLDPPGLCFTCAMSLTGHLKKPCMTLLPSNLGKLWTLLSLLQGYLSRLIYSMMQNKMVHRSYLNDLLTLSHVALWYIGSYRTLEVNLAAAAKATRTAVQHFIKNDKPGLVIHTSSIYGFCGAPLAPLYAASKHGVSVLFSNKCTMLLCSLFLLQIIGLAKSYGTLFRSTNIRVNAVAPHFVGMYLLWGYYPILYHLTCCIVYARHTHGQWTIQGRCYSIRDGTHVTMCECIYTCHWERSTEW